MDCHEDIKKGKRVANLVSEPKNILLENIRSKFPNGYMF